MRISNAKLPTLLGWSVKTTFTESNSKLTPDQKSGFFVVFRKAILILELPIKVILIIRLELVSENPRLVYEK